MINKIRLHVSQWSTVDLTNLKSNGWCIKFIEEYEKKYMDKLLTPIIIIILIP